jgi:hypothetical protein
VGFGVERSVHGTVRYGSARATEGWRVGAGGVVAEWWMDGWRMGGCGRMAAGG